jgi:hypothetical protein
MWGIFVRAVALCYAVTFVSESRQMLGLVGSHGILPISEFIQVGAHDLSAPYRYFRLPTLFWLNASDGLIAAVPWLGALASLMVLGGVWSRSCLLVCYCLHQSTVLAGGDFFFYPWDFLLLETTLLALFVPTLRRLPSLEAVASPPPIVALAIHFLLFRLQFGMGTHKFFNASDEGWRHLTYVFRWEQAQPMPTAAAWYAFNYGPRWMHAGMDLLTFVAEVPMPFLLFIAGRPRLFAALTILVLHLGIAVLGNFGTFQLISIALCLPCIDDARAYAALHWVKRRLGRSDEKAQGGDQNSSGGQPDSALTQVEAESGVSSVKARTAIVERIDAFAGATTAAAAMVCGLLFTVRMMQPNGMTVLSNTRWLFTPQAEQSVTYAGMRLLRLVSPFFLSYPYGIFRDSAPDGAKRSGIVFQGSDDGVRWKTYENKFNPVEPVERPPRFFAPYQPRMDHLFIYESGRFHFAYINGINPYYGARTPLNFIAERLFEQSADVLALFASNPFPAHPPALLRIRVAKYRFTTPAERAASGEWWARSEETIVGPVDRAGTAEMTAAERTFARWALQRVVEVDEHKRDRASVSPLAENKAEVWMPPWKFWLAAAPGWLPLGCMVGLGLNARWRKPRRRA